MDDNEDIPFEETNFEEPECKVENMDVQENTPQEINIKIEDEEFLIPCTDGFEEFEKECEFEEEVREACESQIRLAGKLHLL